MDYAWIVQGFSLDFAAAEVLCAACGGTVCDSKGGGFCVYLGVGRGSSIILHEIWRKYDGFEWFQHERCMVSIGVHYELCMGLCKDSVRIMHECWIDVAWIVLGYCMDSVWSLQGLCMDVEVLHVFCMHLVILLMNVGWNFERFVHRSWMDYAWLLHTF